MLHAIRLCTATDRNMHIAHGMQKQLVDAGDSGPVTGIRVTGEVEAEFCDWCMRGA